MKDLIVNFIPCEKFNSMPLNKKINLILSLIEKSEVIITEGEIGADAQLELIEAVMQKVNSQFHGIEIFTLAKKAEYYQRYGNFRKLKKFLITLLGGRESGLTVIGPAELIQQIKKNPEKIIFNLE